MTPTVRATAKPATADRSPPVTRATAVSGQEPQPPPKSSLRHHPAGVAHIIDPHLPEPKRLPLADAEAQGYTLIDLSNDWRPFIFSDQTPGVADEHNNSYARRFINAANDRYDYNGERRPSHRRKYLELFGIPPSLGALLHQWRELRGVTRSCLTESDYNPDIFTRFDRKLYFRAHAGKKRLKAEAKARAKLDKAMRKAKIKHEDWPAAQAHRRTKNLYVAWRKLADEVELITQAQIRLRCERMYTSADGRGKIKLGNFDFSTQKALAQFERKHKIMGFGHFNAENIAQLAKPLDEGEYQRLLRIIRARVISGAGILEDGSAGQWQPDFRWKTKSGLEQPLRNLSNEAVQRALQVLGLDDAESAFTRLEQLARMSSGEFDQFIIGIQLPELPEYYSRDMNFHVVIDRGDVWYDFIYDSRGKRRNQPRATFPHLTLWTTYEGQEIPLIHWRTTIGSWRSEEHEGKEYLVYKNSDVGHRVWKDIVAAPVWVPPASTPTRGLVRTRIRRGRPERVVNYNETGPGYQSAYGLVAAYHIEQIKAEDGTVLRERDNQIRTHGSVDYTSILRRYSHGCHRLYNLDAVELFSFILGHRDYQRIGQVPLGYRREFNYEGQNYHMKLDTRGYRYELTEPIAVEVLKGQIRGKRKRPFAAPLPKPGVDYEEPESEGPAAAEQSPESPAGAAAPPDTPPALEPPPKAED